MKKVRQGKAAREPAVGKGSKSGGKSRAGRPTAFRMEYCLQANKLARIGLTDKQMADFFGVSEVTFNAWKKAYPEFLNPLKDGKDEADKLVEASLYLRAIGYSHPSVKIFNHNGKLLRAEYIEHFPPDPTSMIFWLKNRQSDKWRDKQQHEHLGKDGGPIEIKEMADFEFCRRIAFLLDKGVRLMEKKRNEEQTEATSGG